MIDTIYFKIFQMVRKLNKNTDKKLGSWSQTKKPKLSNSIFRTETAFPLNLKAKPYIHFMILPFYLQVFHIKDGLWLKQ